MYHAPSPYQLPSHPSPYRLHHTMPKPMRDKIHHFWITSNDHFTKQIHLFSNQNIFGCYTSMIICIQNHVSFLWVANFRSLTSGFASLPTLSRAFTVGHKCTTKNTGAFTQGGIYPCLLIPDTFSFSFIHPCDIVGCCPCETLKPGGPLTTRQLEEYV